MDAASGFLLILLPLLLVGEAIAGTLVWQQNPGVLHRLAGGRLAGCLLRRKPLGIAALVAAWLLLTVTSLWCLFLGAFIAVYVLYFSLGAVGAWAGLIAAGVLMVCTPFAWGRILLSLAKREFEQVAAEPSVPVLLGWTPVWGQRHE